MAGGSHSHRQYLQSFMGIILFYTVNLHRNKVFAMPTHLLYFKPYSLTQNLWPGTSWIWILIKEPHSTLQGSPPGAGCGVSDCEELVGVNHMRWCCWPCRKNQSIKDYSFSSNILDFFNALHQHYIVLININQL